MIEYSTGEAVGHIEEARQIADAQRQALEGTLDDTYRYRLAVIRAEAALEGMKSENRRCELLGKPPKYCAAEYEALIEQITQELTEQEPRLNASA